MGVWIAIVAYYSVYSFCFIAKAIHMRKRAHAEIGGPEGHDELPHLPRFA